MAIRNRVKPSARRRMNYPEIYTSEYLNEFTTCRMGTEWSEAEENCCEKETKSDQLRIARLKRSRRPSSKTQFSPSFLIPLVRRARPVNDVLTAQIVNRAFGHENS